jgi:hypothetical protein
MKLSLRIITGILACLALSAAAAIWATGYIDSLYNYRSPLHADPPAPGEALGRPITRRVVFVLIDALRLDTSLQSGIMPFLNSLRQQGAWATMHSQPPSYSQPGYSVLLSGAWPELSDGPAMNLPYESIPTWTQDNLFSAAHRSGLQTAVAGYYWFEKLIPQVAVTHSFYTTGEDQAADRQVVAAAIPWLEAGSDQLVLIHIDQVDYAGHHEGGPIDPRWEAAARRADELLRSIAASLDLSQDTLLVASDHGQIDRGGHGGDEPVTLREPLVLTGAGVKPGHYRDVNMVDVAPILAVMLGLNLPATSQGKAQVGMLALSPAQLEAIRQAEQAQQSRLVSAYQQAIGWTVLVKDSTMGVTAYQDAMQAARAARTQAERWRRIPLALVAGLSPALILIRRHTRRKAWGELAWLMGSAGLYLLLFNLFYARLDRQTYSLSALSGTGQVLRDFLLNGVFTLAIGWLAAFSGLKLWRRSPASATEASLGFIGLTLYGLALPILWSYGMNGAQVSWRLPDFPSSFLAFLALTQVVVASIAGLFLTGMAALLASMYRR